MVGVVCTVNAGNYYKGEDPVSVAASVFASVACFADVFAAFVRDDAVGNRPVEGVLVIERGRGVASPIAPVKS